MTRASAFRSVVWNTDGGPGPWRFVAVSGDPRYSVTGELTAEPGHAPTLTTVVVTDRDTGASVTFRGTAATLSVAGDASVEHVQRLWADARRLADDARRPGRPPEASARQRAILEVLQTADRADGPPKMRDVAAQLGRLDPHDESRTTRDFQRDVAALGGWRRIRDWF